MSTDQSVGQSVDQSGGTGEAGGADEAAAGSVWDWTLAAFRDRTASDAPTPGGGSAAMVSAAIGMGLVLMALRVTLRKSTTPESLQPAIDAGDRLLVELSDQADVDIAVFEAYMAALKLPRASDAEKAARRAALDRAGEAGTETLLNAAQSCLESLNLAEQAAFLAQSNILSDVGAGASLVHGAVEAVLGTVDMNLPGIKDEVQRDDFAHSRDHLGQAASRAYGRVRQSIAERSR